MERQIVNRSFVSFLPVTHVHKAFTPRVPFHSLRGTMGMEVGFYVMSHPAFHPTSDVHKAFTPFPSLVSLHPHLTFLTSHGEWTEEGTTDGNEPWAVRGRVT